jgi:hypothetical protein
LRIAPGLGFQSLFDDRFQVNVDGCLTPPSGFAGGVKGGFAIKHLLQLVRSLLVTAPCGCRHDTDLQTELASLVG